MNETPAFEHCHVLTLISYALPVYKNQFAVLGMCDFHCSFKGLFRAKQLFITKGNHPMAKEENGMQGCLLLTD